MIRVLLMSILQGVCLPLFAWQHSDAPADTAGFTLVKTSDDIRLYERWYALSAEQQAREIKAVFTIRNDYAAALALLKDGANGELWNNNTNTYETVDVRPDSWTCYIHYDLPWPVSDQDCVLQYNSKERGEILTVTFQATEHPVYPVKNRIQRIPDIRGKWIFEKVDNGVKVEYFVTTKPSKQLPGWMTDPIIRNNLTNTLHEFRRILEGNYTYPDE